MPCFRTLSQVPTTVSGSRRSTERRDGLLAKAQEAAALPNLWDSYVKWREKAYKPVERMGRFGKHRWLLCGRRPSGKVSPSSTRHSRLAGHRRMTFPASPLERPWLRREEGDRVASGLPLRF